MITVNAKGRENHEKNRRMRREGWIPAILDQRSTIDTDNQSIKIKDSDCDRLLRVVKVGGLVSLDVEGKAYKAFITEVQREPMTNQLQHLSFEELRPEKNVKSVAQISLTGGNMQKYEYILTRQAVPYEAITQDMIESICLNLDNYDKPMNVTVEDLNKRQNSTFRVLLDDTLEILHIKQRPGWSANEQ